MECLFLSRFPCVKWSLAGGVLSPIQFTIYTDDLLKHLKSLGMGCQWDGYFAGAVCADDVALLAPSLSALHLMLHYGEDFAVSCGLTFNASKTQLICFDTQPSLSCSVTICFSGIVLPFCDVIVHLGHHRRYDLSDADDILFKTQDLML